MQYLKKARMKESMHVMSQGVYRKKDRRVLLQQRGVYRVLYDFVWSGTGLQFEAMALLPS